MTGIIGFLSLLIVVGALWVVTVRNLFRAALSLGIVLLGVAGVFIVLEAEFLAFVQILVYVGAILTLVIFAIMLTAKRQLASNAPASRQRGPAAVAAVGVFAALCSATAPLAVAHPQADAVSLSSLGQGLVTTLVLPFEIVSLVLVAAMVGAIAIAAPRGRVDAGAPRSAPSIDR